MSNAGTEIIDAVPCIGAIVDETGDIVRVNQAWRKFGNENGLDSEYEILGTNYLEVTRRADDPHSQHLLEKLSKLLDRDLSSFTAEYPCHSPQEPRWFRIHANAVGDADDRRVMVLHENITDERVTRLLSEPVWNSLLTRLETSQTTHLPADVDLFETELGTVLRAAYDNGISVEGVYSFRNDFPYPDWEIIIDRVEKLSD
ncbi:MAG: PAS domain-containing protein [Natronomonas sp.]